MKFEKFVDVLFKSRMQTEDVKDQIIKYVQALETSYTDAIRDLKDMVEKEKRKQKTTNSERINTAFERNELETLFVDCIEEVRKDIMRRRLKNEIYNRKKF
jgi:polyribonucleotide nucleotidyltransferase